MKTSLTLGYWSLPVWTKSVSAFIEQLLCARLCTRRYKYMDEQNKVPPFPGAYDLVGRDKVIIGFIYNTSRTDECHETICYSKGKGWTLPFL